MSQNQKDLATKLRELGIKTYESAKEGIQNATDTVEKTIRNEKLRQRFNLEYPFKFAVSTKPVKVNFITNLMAYHAKFYEEDDILVFFGKKSSTALFQVGSYVRDLAKNNDYKILDVIDVTVPVTYDHKEYEVPGTAVNLQAL